jgi:malate dehydrogenase (quinone)
MTGFNIAWAWRKPWSAKLKEIIPSYGQSLAENAALCQRVRAETAAILKINNMTEVAQ